MPSSSNCGGFSVAVAYMKACLFAKAQLQIRTGRSPSLNILSMCKTLLMTGTSPSHSALQVQYIEDCWRSQL